MAWLSFVKGRGVARWVIGVAAAILAVSWVLKLRDLQGLRSQVALTETRLKSAQDLWRRYPPLEPEKRKELERTQGRLLRGLPKDEDIPALYEEISRLAREFNLSEMTIGPDGPGAKAGAGTGPSPAGPPSVAPVAPASPPPSAEDFGPIGSFTVRVNFTGDYREIAYFLDGLKELPRLVTVQSLQLRRRVPTVSVEILLRGYYRKGGLPGGST
jgi:Tfp pilus assembly protein PilO